MKDLNQTILKIPFNCKNVSYPVCPVFVIVIEKTKCVTINEQTYTIMPGTS